MKKLTLLTGLLLSGSYAARAQEFSFNASGVLNTTNSMVEVLQSSTTSGTVGLFARHNGAATNAYAVWAEVTAGTNRYALVVPSGGGNVGIGTTTPSVPLDVTSTGTIGIRYIKTGAADARITLGDPTQNWSWATGWATGGDFSLIEEGTSGNRIYVKRTTGNVGIGTSTPVYKLDVVAPANNWKARFEGTDGYIDIGPANAGWAHIYTDRPNFIFNQNVWSIPGGFSAYNTADLALQTNGTTRITALNSNGNVGIGVTNPAYNLEVNGTFGFGDGTAGSYRSRTESRADAGQMATQSGFFQTSAPAPAADWPAGAASWWHLLDVRHSNPGNNYAMQFAGSFFDQDLYCRKTNNNAAQAWAKIITTANIASYAVGDNLGNHTATTTLNMTNNAITNIWDSYNGGWYRNNTAGQGLYNQATGAGIYSPSANLMTLYGASSLQITSASDGSGNLRFDAANPYIVSSSYYVCPGGAYFNSGTVYTEAQYQCRGGIHNDANSYLTIAGGTSAVSYFTGNVGILNAGPSVPLDVIGAGVLGNSGDACARSRVGWYVGAEPFIGPSCNARGYCGSSFPEAWWYVSSYNWYNPSRREIKRNITPVNEDPALIEFVMNDIDKIKPSFYKYKMETDQFESGNEAKYRAQMHLGVILDESPDYILDQSFSGIDVYGISALALAGVKHNRKEIKEIKEFLSMGTTTTTINDFGSMAMSGTETFVRFSDDFIGKTSSSDNTMPAITVTPLNVNASLYITEITKEGFKVKNGMLNQSPVTFNWIAMAKVKSPAYSENQKTTPQISSDILDQIKVPLSIKSKANNYFINLKPTATAGGK